MMSTRDKIPPEIYPGNLKNLGISPEILVLGKSIPTNVGPTPYCAHVAETCLKFGVGQFSGRVLLTSKK